MLVEMAVWLAVSVLACDLVVRPVLFGVHLGREILPSSGAARLPLGQALWRACRRTAASHVAITVVALVVVTVAVVAGQWSGLVLGAGTWLAVRAWRRHRKSAVAVRAAGPRARSSSTGG